MLSFNTVFLRKQTEHISLRLFLFGLRRDQSGSSKSMSKYAGIVPFMRETYQSS